MKLKSLLILVFGVLCFYMNAQTFVYTYDAAGNRSNRHVLTLKSALIDTTITSVEVDSSFVENNSFSSIDKNKANIGMDNLGDVRLSLYPNPTAGKVVIKIDNLAEYSFGQIMVYDSKGTLLIRKNGVGQSSEISLFNYPGGNYIVKIIVDNKVSEWKIIKE
ncbi:MAG: T9SS type A sorting domain-containing protein [Salinivirgaceae bacterium]|nr:T9SS type A sorting domain-containing protein [Salinivirgaceae bacterium]